VGGWPLNLTLKGHQNAIEGIYGLLNARIFFDYKFNNKKNVLLEK
jgi:hypothetical protein